MFVDLVAGLFGLFCLCLIWIYFIWVGGLVIWLFGLVVVVVTFICDLYMAVYLLNVGLLVYLIFAS